MTRTALAIYENGTLRLLTPLDLPEHTHVQVHIELFDEQAVSSRTHVLHHLLNIATDLGVDDLAEQHDYYLYGVEKQ